MLAIGIGPTAPAIGIEPRSRRLWASCPAGWALHEAFHRQASGLAHASEGRTSLLDLVRWFVADEHVWSVSFTLMPWLRAEGIPFVMAPDLDARVFAQDERNAEMRRLIDLMIGRTVDTALPQDAD